MKKQKFTEHIQKFDFKTMFNEFGWDNFDNTLPVTVKDSVYNLIGVSEKQGIKVKLIEFI